VPAGNGDDIAFGLRQSVAVDLAVGVIGNSASATKRDGIM
jgi:hypothetical protein